MESFKEAFQSLEEGISVGIFPEGTRTRKRLPGKPGLGLLVAKSKRPVLPVTVKNTGTALKNLLNPSREPIEIIYHPPVRFQIPEQAPKEELIEVSERVLDIIYSKL